MINSKSIPDTIQNDIVNLLNEISLIPEHSLLDKIISYCEKNDYNVKEIGDILSESEQFKTMLEKELIKNKIFKPEEPEGHIEIDEW